MALAALGAMAHPALLRRSGTRWPPARRRGLCLLPCAVAASAEALQQPAGGGLLPPRLVLAGQPVPPETWDNAAVLVDKPKDWTSFDVCAKLRGALRVKLPGQKGLKVGHAGTLDPMATGLLIVCTGRATKWVDFFVAQEKAYSGVIRLGEETPSYDAETEVNERSAWAHLSDEDLKRAASSFLGDILQVPPMYSALKQKGVPLYVKARAGEVVERAARQLHIARFDVWRDAPGSQDVHFAVTCSKGTYIRSLAHDLGAALGTHAHLVALRRDSIGQHQVSNAWALESLLTSARAQRQA